VERSIIFAGFGGQGILFAGKVLARAAMNEDLEVLWIPSYGPEMRGGTASCTVILGSDPIGSPIVDQADAAVVLNPPSYAKFASHVAPGGLLVVNETLVGDTSGRTDITELRIPCTRLAKDAGVLLEARQDVSRRASGVRIEGEFGRERLRPLFQSFNAQEFIAQGLLSGMPCAAGEQTEKRFQGRRRRDA